MSTCRLIAGQAVYPRCPFPIKCRPTETAHVRYNLIKDKSTAIQAMGHRSTAVLIPEYALAALAVHTLL